MMILGVAGGLGPLATACFLRRCVEMTDAGSDQEHLEIALLNRPSTPDRTAYILDRSQPGFISYSRFIISLPDKLIYNIYKL